MADYLQAQADHARMMETLRRREAEVQRRREERAADHRATLDRLPAAMLADLTALKSALGPLAIRWIEIDGETLHGREPDRSGRVVPVKQHLAAGGKA